MSAHVRSKEATRGSPARVLGAALGPLLAVGLLAGCGAAAGPGPTAIGSPLGLGGSVTEGIVSAVGRSITEPASAGSPAAVMPR